MASKIADVERHKKVGMKDTPAGETSARSAERALSTSHHVQR